MFLWLFARFAKDRQGVTIHIDAQTLKHIFETRKSNRARLATRITSVEIIYQIFN